MRDVHVAEYDPLWPRQFEQLRDELAGVFTGVDVRIEHVGSTSVPGLCAKAVLDVLVGAPDLRSIEARIAEMRSRGFEYVPEYEAQLPLRRYFRRAAGRLPRVHVHAVCEGSRLWAEHLAFRDALRRDPALRGSYAELKRRLAAAHPGDRTAYTEAKGPFIQHAMRSLLGPA